MCTMYIPQSLLNVCVRLSVHPLWKVGGSDLTPRDTSGYMKGVDTFSKWGSFVITAHEACEKV